MSLSMCLTKNRNNKGSNQIMSKIKICFCTRSYCKIAQILLEFVDYLYLIYILISRRKYKLKYNDDILIAQKLDDILRDGGTCFLCIIIGLNLYYHSETKRIIAVNKRLQCTSSSVIHNRFRHKSCL